VPLCPRRTGWIFVRRATSILDKESLTLMKRISPRSLSAVSVVIALLLTNFNCLSFVRVAHAGRADKPSHSIKGNKISPLLKDDKHAPDELVTIIATLEAPRSGRLNAFLAQNGVHERRQMKALGAFSLTLPFNLVGELAAFPEISHVSSNETVRTLGHVSVTTGADAGQAGALSAGRGSIDGAGMSIAVLDSGIDTNRHQSCAVCRVRRWESNNREC
jgi:hypothetical protein